MRGLINKLKKVHETKPKHRGVKVNYKFLKLAFLLILIPFLMGCNIKPEDQWPVIVNENIDANFTVIMTIPEALPIPFLTIAKDTVDMTIDIRSYNANQGWDVKVVLEDIIVYATDWGDLTLPIDSIGKLGITETYRIENVIGNYISGNPPQGITEIKLYFTPSWLPLSFNDWIQGTIKVDRYEYYYILIIEDMGGLTDSWEFVIVSTLVIA